MSLLHSLHHHIDRCSTEADDLKARAANLRQVSTYIKTYSAGNPVLVFGDTNSRYTRADDIPAVFTTENGMTDAWVQLIRAGKAPTPGNGDLVCTNPSTTTSCEIVDKVWYRGSPAVALTATKFQYVGNMFLQTNGDILSDHNPVLIDFSWNTGSASLQVSDPWGGPHGTFYNDLSTLSDIPSPKASSITLRGASRLDGISLTLASGQTFTHGGTGGTANTLKLNAGESLTSATMCQAQYQSYTRLFYMEVKTSTGRTISAGTKSGDCVTRTADSGWGIVGFTGRAGDEIDRAALVYAKL